MNPDNLAVIIFDCDGVMFDTADANRSFYNRILRHLGKPEMTDAQFNYVQMSTVDQALAFLFDDETTLASAQAFQQTMGYEEFITDMKPEPDLYRVLDQLRKHYHTAIATNRKDTMGRVLEAFDLQNRFDVVITAQDVDRAKPFPDPLIRILTHFQITSHQALYIGDSSVDEQAAKAAGVPFVAFRNRALTANHHIHQLDELLTILKRS